MSSIISSVLRLVALYPLVFHLLLVPSCLLLSEHRVLYDLELVMVKVSPDSDVMGRVPLLVT